MKAQLPITLKITVLFFFLISASSHAQNTYVPDDNFESTLISLGYDTYPLDDYVPTANISGITTLNVSNQSISDLTGIEDFTALTELYCANNNLTSLYISANTALTFLWCSSNNLTNLDISNNTTLTNLNCQLNNLTSLDISNNTALQFLVVSGNNFSEIDLSNNTALESLECDDNNLTTLDLSNNDNLKKLYFGGNNLSEIDLSNLIALEELLCDNNALVNLDLSQNPNLSFLECSSNNLLTLNVKNGNNINITGYFFSAYDNPNLTCIQVDDTAWSTANWTNIDPQSYFSENCALGISELEQNAFSIYPNPARNFFKIITDLPISEIVIYTIEGKIVSKQKKNEKYDVSGLRSGVYFVRVKSDSKTFIKKLLID